MNIIQRLHQHFCPFLIRDKFAGEKVPTLEAAVEECIKLQLTIYFDVKGHPDEVQTTKQTHKPDLMTCNLSVILVDLTESTLRNEENVM